jgi:TolB-like protein
MAARQGLCAAVLAITAATPTAAQDMAGSLEAGLQAIARGLAAGAVGPRPPVLSVMPFPGADQACPVLSVFVADELNTAFVTGVQPRPRVVERLQLETVVAQYRLENFLTDPEQRRRLGGLTGIDALVVGSFVVIGDRVRINARVVGIDSGELVTAHAVSVPRTGELTEMLRQSSGRERNCVASPAAAPAPPPVARPAAPAEPRSPSPNAPSSAADQCQERFGLRVCASDLQHSGRDVRLTLVAENVGQAVLGLLMIGPPPTLQDSAGVVHQATAVDGMQTCGGHVRHSYMGSYAQDSCLRPPNSYASLEDYSRIAPGGRVSATMHFRSERPPSTAPFSLNLVLGVLPLPTSSATPAQRRQANPFFFVADDLQTAVAERR